MLVFRSISCASNSPRMTCSVKFLDPITMRLGWEQAVRSSAAMQATQTAKRLKRISKLHDSCISNPEIRNLGLDWGWSSVESNLRFRISGFEMQESCNFTILLLCRQSSVRSPCEHPLQGA